MLMKLEKFYSKGFLILLIFMLNCEERQQIDLKENEYSKMFRFNEKTKLGYDVKYFPNFKSNYKSIGQKTNVDSMIRHKYGILYIGRGDKFYPYSKIAFDSLVNYPFVFDESRVKRDYYPELDIEKISKADLFLFVDTTQIIKPAESQKSKPKFGEEYAVYLINKSNLWHFEWMESLSLTFIMEAYHKENKKWQPIEYQSTHSGLTFTMPPKSYFVSSSLIYSGDYPTKLRLKYKRRLPHKTIYSNEFLGEINKSQFDTIKFDKENYVSVIHF